MRGISTRRAERGRRTKATVAIVGTAAVVLAGFGIAPSLAGWTRTEFDNGAASSLNCSAGSQYTTNSWAQEIAGQVAGTALDPSLVGASGIAVESGAPHSAVVSGSGADGLSYLGNDAWDSSLAAGALNAISLGATLTLPLTQNTGTETQYARATVAGTATGASGAVTTAGNGLVSLGSPNSSAPGVGSVDLDSALSATVDQKLGGAASELADVSLSIGALGSETSLDSCDALWAGMTDAASVVRSYVLAKLGLTFTSSLVGTTVTDATNSVNSLASTLNLIEPAGTSVTTGSVLTALGTAISNTTSPLLPLSLSGSATVTAGVSFTHSAVLSALTGTTTDGPVTVNLASGQISVDLAQLSGFASLNSQPANTKLLSSAALTSLTTEIDGAISAAITSTLENAIVATLSSAAVTVIVKTPIALAGVAAANLTITISGTAGQFASPGTQGEPTVSIAKVDLSSPALSLVLGLLNLDSVLSTILTNMVTPLTTDLVPVLASAVVSPVITTATTDVSSSITTLNSTTLAPVYSAIGGVIGVVGDAVEVTINAQPDASGSVGSPEPTQVDEFYESALQVGVLDTVDASSTLSLFFGSSAAGPDVEN